MKGLIVATQFLTRLPTPRLTVSDAEFARSMRWFPAVGLVVGTVVASGAWAGAQLDPWLGALCGLVLWAGVTGALHLDGLGDVADAMGAAHKDRERLLAVLADPHAGSFAIVAIVLQVVAKLVLLHELAVAGAVLPVIAVPFAARIGPLVWTILLPPLHQGLGAKFRGAVGWRHVAVWAALLAAIALQWPVLLTAPLFILLWGRQLRRAFGGISGDGHGAGIELVETGLLLALVLGARLAP